MSMMKVEVQREERVFVYVDGKVRRYLAPGNHWVFEPFSKVTLIRCNTSTLIADLDADQLQLVPEGDLAQVTVGSTQRALVSRRGRPVRWLGVGQHQVWTVDKLPRRSAGSEQVQLIPAVEVELFDVSSVETKPLRDEVRALVPATDHVETTAGEGTVAMRYVDGVLDAVLPPGRHAAWNVAHKVNFAVIDLRERLLHVTGQEVLTKDRVSLRLNLSAAFQVSDPKRLATVARTPDDVLYLAMQLAAREAVATHTLDELLTTRDALSVSIQQEVVAKASVVGLQVLSFGIKDVVLPGEMKELLNRVIQAQKEAEANVILRREETAATRSMAQTAKVLAENPLLVRLKELETYKDLAAKVGQVHLVLGEGGLPKLELKTS
jgi:regulator of protease activity HflC (stomatin/prohibitin superfamily)